MRFTIINQEFVLSKQPGDFSLYSSRFFFSIFNEEFVLYTKRRVLYLYVTKSLLSICNLGFILYTQTSVYSLYATNSLFSIRNQVFFGPLIFCEKLKRTLIANGVVTDENVCRTCMINNLFIYIKCPK